MVRVRSMRKFADDFTRTLKVSTETCASEREAEHKQGRFAAKSKI